MKKYKYNFETELNFSSDIYDHQFTLHCVPKSNKAQYTEKSSVSVYPEVPLFENVDGFKNKVLNGSILPPHSSFFYRSEGVVSVNNCPDTHLNSIYKYPSILTKPENGIRIMHSSLDLSGTDMLLDSEIIFNATGNALAYSPGSTDSTTTAEQTLFKMRGVCQDYAHLMIALARLSGIPARYCMGLCLGEGATHAWVQLYINGSWHGFDPTQRRHIDSGYICFATGRDAFDCLAERGVFRGAAVSQTQNILMKLEEI